MSQNREVPSRPSFSLGFLSGLTGQAAYLLLSLPASILLARALGPDGKGAVDLSLLLPYLVTLFSSLGLGSAGAYLIGAGRFPREEILGTLAGLWLIVATILTPLYVLAALLGILQPLAPHVATRLILVGALLIPFGLGQQYLGSALLGQQRFVAYSSLRSVMAAVNLAGIGVLVCGLSLGSLGGVISSTVSQVACVLYLLLLLKGSWDGRPRLNRAVIRQAMSYGVRGQVGTLMQFFNYRLDVLLLGYFRSLEEVGLYTLAVSLAEFVWYVPNASALVIFPRTAAAQDEARSFTPLVFRITSVATLVAALILASVAEPLIALVYGPAFQRSALPFYLLLPGVVCLGGAKVLTADLSGRGLPGYNTMGALISLIVTVLLDFLFIPSFGLVGAAVASSVAYITTLIYTLVVYGRVSQAPPWPLFRLGRSDVRALREAIARLRGVRPR